MLVRVFSFAVLAAACVVSNADETNFSGDQIDFFNKQVLTVLEDNCLKCHAGDSPKGGLLLTTREGIFTLTAIWFRR